MSEINLLYKNLPVVSLHPGELFVAQEPTIITTILGSCVSVCLYCPVKKIGAMCHGVMPFSPDGAAENSFRFVNRSVSYMADVMTGLHGLSCAKLEAKLFGGADVFSVGEGQRRKAPTIGEQNIDAARVSLKKRGIPVIVEKVGGVNGRKLFFYTHTGEVYLRRISRICRIKR